MTANKSIIVKEENKEKIRAVIKEAQGKATSRMIDYEWIIEATKRIDVGLNIPKKYMDGLVYDVDINAQDFPNAYKYVPESTHFVLTYKKGSWRVSDVARCACRRYGHTYECLNMPQETADAILLKKQTF